MRFLRNPTTSVEPREIVTMGDEIGVFTTKEVAGLDKNDHRLLRELTFATLFASKEIRAIVEKGPIPVTQVPPIHQALRDQLTPILSRLSKK